MEISDHKSIHIPAKMASPDFETREKTNFSESRKAELFRKAKAHAFKKSKEYDDAIAIKGYDFSQPFDFDKFLASYMSTGCQASHLGIAIEIIKKMRQDKATIFLGYSSNMVTSGLREVIAWLVKNKLVHVLVTTAGGIEEDLIKCLGNFVLGSFNTDDTKLRDLNINRAGNILIPDNRYIEFENFIQPFLKKMLERQKKTGQIISASKLINELGAEINNEDSILYWAYKNNIPVFCPALTDGTLGDQISFFKYKSSEFKLDISDDIHKINEFAIQQKNKGVIILGSGFAKHHILNAVSFGQGADYAVYVSTETEEGGSDSGARVQEAISWWKVKSSAQYIKVYGDATIIFPLIIAGAFKQ